jgi:hypothetical protein
MNLDFTGGMYASRSCAVDGQECINWYPEVYGEGDSAKNSMVLMPTPGLSVFAQSKAGGAVRALYVTGTGRMFAVIGSTLSEFTESGTEVIRGTLRTFAGNVCMADNGTGSGRGIGLILVDGKYGYFLNLSTNIFTHITDVSFPQSSSVVFLDGYFIANENGTGKVWCSNPYNGLDWGDNEAEYDSCTTLDITTGTKDIAIAKNLVIGSGDTSVVGDTAVIAHSTSNYMTGEVLLYEPVNGILTVNIKEIVGSGSWSSWTLCLYTGSTKYAYAESNTDPVVALKVVRNELWVFGTQSLEVWYNSGAADFPFTRTHGASNNIGTVSLSSIAVIGNTVFWLGSNAQGHGTLWQASDYSPNKVSPTGIDSIIEQMPELSDAQAYCYSQAGHSFYVISFPAGNRTLCYDLSTGMWHERACWNSLEGAFVRHKGGCACFFNGMPLIGDYASGMVYRFDLENYTDNGVAIRRVRTGPHIHSDRMRLFFNGFEIDVERGVGLSDGLGSDPQTFLQWSDDGGYTWSSEHWASPGRQGRYANRMRWNRLGCSRDRVFRLTISDPVKTVVIAARADVSVEG